MADKKRLSVRDRRESDLKGVDRILGGIPENRRLSEPAEQDTSEEARQGRGAVSKMTVYVRPDQVVDIESIQLAERRRTGQRVDKSELIQKALDLLKEAYQKDKTF